MSLHKSLVSKNKLARQRSVLTRAERLTILEEDGRWEAGKSVFGLPKVRTLILRKKKKKAKEEAASAEGAEATTAEAATPTPEAKKK